MQNCIKAVRQELGLTQAELSELSGISRTIISNLENEATKTITTDTMMALAKALNKEVSEIFFFG